MSRQNQLGLGVVGAGGVATFVTAAVPGTQSVPLASVQSALLESARAARATGSHVLLQPDSTMWVVPMPP